MLGDGGVIGSGRREEGGDFAVFALAIPYLRSRRASRLPRPRYLRYFSTFC